MSERERKSNLMQRLMLKEDREIEKQTVRHNKRCYKNSSGVLIWWRYEAAHALLKSSYRDTETNKHSESVHSTQMWCYCRHYKVMCRSRCTYKASQRSWVHWVHHCTDEFTSASPWRTSRFCCSGIQSETCCESQIKRC